MKSIQIEKFGGPEVLVIRDMDIGKPGPKEVLIKNKFENIEVKEVILRDWVVDKKIVRPSNKLVSHTGFIISGRYIKY